MSYPFYAIFGSLPSLAWLLFYLRKDKNPESNRQILKTFSWGMFAALPAVFLEIGVFEVFSGFKFPSLLVNLLNIFIGVALVEEILKYMVIKNKILPSSHFDEPVDLMIYMITAALGFAAVENILILFQLGPGFLPGRALEVSLFRFFGATFLHALASGLVGYFLAKSICAAKNKNRLIVFGLAISIVLHGLYNFSIMRLAENFKLMIPAAILIGLAIFISLGFKKLKKMKSVCIIK